MSKATAPRQRGVAGSLLPGALGGLVVLVLGGVLIATGVIDAGETRTVVRESPLAGRAADGDGREGRTVTDIYRDVGPGVVFVQARGVTNESPFGVPGERGTATGSGFVLDREGYIVTNDHLVEGSDDVSVKLRQDDDPVDADVRGRDPSSDLALLKVDPDAAELDPVPLGDSSKVRVGDPTVAIGNPFGLDRTVTTGIVSAVQRQISAPNGFTISGAIQTDASINPGNSGGPLLDADGRVIGVNSQIATGGGRGSVGIGFAVPVNTLEDVVPKLKRSGRVERPFIGVETVDLTDELARRIDAGVDDGALVVRVADGSPADDAGLRSARVDLEGNPAAADVIVRVDGRRIRDGEDIAAAIADRQPGDEIELELFRGKERRRLELELDERPTRGVQSPGERSEPLIP